MKIEYGPAFPGSKVMIKKLVVPDIEFRSTGLKPGESKQYDGYTLKCLWAPKRPAK